MSKKISHCVNSRLEEILRLYHSCFPCHKISNASNTSSIWLISGVEIFGKGLGDLYYASNQMDPYLKDKDVSTQLSFDAIWLPLPIWLLMQLQLPCRMRILKILRTWPLIQMMQSLFVHVMRMMSAISRHVMHILSSLSCAHSHALSMQILMDYWL